MQTKCLNSKSLLNKWIMCHLFVFFMLSSQATIFAQDSSSTAIKKHAVMFALSNNGQIKNELASFYATFNTSPELSSVQSNILTYNFFYTYQLNLNYHLGVKLAYTKRTETITIAETIAQNDESKINQHLFGTSFFLKRKVNLHPSIVLSSGIEIPFFIVGDFTSTSMNDNNFFTSQEILKKSGGIVVGLNNITSLSYFITKTISFNINTSFGILYYNLGDELEIKSVSSNKTTNEVQQSIFMDNEHTMEKITFSGAELFFGVMVHF